LVHVIRLHEDPYTFMILLLLYYDIYYYDSGMCVVCGTAHNTYAALRHAATSTNLYNDVILPSVLT